MFSSMKEVLDCGDFIHIRPLCGIAPQRRENKVYHLKLEKYSTLLMSRRYPGIFYFNGQEQHSTVN